MNCFTVHYFFSLNAWLEKKRVGYTNQPEWLNAEGEARVLLAGG